MQLAVNTDESYTELLSTLKDGFSLDTDYSLFNSNNKKVASLDLDQKYKDDLALDDIIHGKNKETNVVNISIDNDLVYVFKEIDGKVEVTTRPYAHWVLTKKPIHKYCTELIGNQPYKYYSEYSQEEFTELRSRIYTLGATTIYNEAENFMIRNGFTYFKGMKSSEVSLLSFDIETTGLDPHADDAKVFLITNTYRNNGLYINKTFCVEDYDSDYEMIKAWEKWVCEVNPTLLLGHNLVMFDLPYLIARVGGILNIGRMNKTIHVEDKVRELRKDGSQTYSYNRINCFGREIVDTFFLAIKADIARKYESYRLKSIIAQEGMEEAGRVHYDGADIKKNWHLPEERSKIIAYAEADSRDPIKLFDLMIPSFFYLTPYIPKPFQIMIESATGSQINALMVRSYLQKDMSVAEGSKGEDFEGAISFGVPGIYANVFKVDVASLYPSIMRHYNIFPKGKDFNNHFMKMLNYFTVARLKNKALAKETKDRFYDDLQNAMKVVINSAYGFMGAKGLNYNFPEGAALVTRYGREIIAKACTWANGNSVDKVVKKIVNEGKPNEKIEYEWIIGNKVSEGKGYVISNCDTDSISFTCNQPLSTDQRKSILLDLNSNYPDAIRFEDDGYYNRVCILKAKNYILFDGKKIKVKGSSLKDQKKEPALKELMDKIINCLVFDTRKTANAIYQSYIKEAYNPIDIKRWCAKKTITKAVMACAYNPEVRMNEMKVYSAVKDLPGLQEGDKVYLYPCVLSLTTESSTNKNGKIKEKVIKVVGLKNCSDWSADEDKDKLVERVVDTMDVFTNVMDTDQFIDYTLVKNRLLLTELVS